MVKQLADIMVDERSKAKTVTVRKEITEGKEKREEVSKRRRKKGEGRQKRGKLKRINYQRAPILMSF